MDRRVKERLIGATILMVLVVLIVPELLSGPKRPSGEPTATRGMPSQTVTVEVHTHATTRGPAQSVAPPVAPTPANAAARVAALPADEAAAAGAPSAESAAEGQAPAQVQSEGSAIRADQAMRPVPASTEITTRPAVSNGNSSGAVASGAVASGAVASGAAASGAASPAGAASSAAAAGAWAVQFGSFKAEAHADKLVRELKGEGYTVYVSSIGAGSEARYRVRMGPLVDRDAAERTVAKLKAHRIDATIVPPAP
jgi:DedD protein